ncbi:MAG: hypothetical protein AB8V03_06130 [Francisella endosymbiont of Hyalomma asiaticum]
MGMEEGILPHQQSIEDDSIEESVTLHMLQSLELERISLSL